MSKLRLRISMSLDGYVAGPDQSVQNPLGIGGERNDPFVQPLASDAERVLHTLVGPGHVTVERHRDPEAQLGHVLPFGKIV